MEQEIGLWNKKFKVRSMFTSSGLFYLQQGWDQPNLCIVFHWRRSLAPSSFRTATVAIPTCSQDTGCVEYHHFNQSWHHQRSAAISGLKTQERFAFNMERSPVLWSRLYLTMMPVTRQPDKIDVACSKEVADMMPKVNYQTTGDYHLSGWYIRFKSLDHEPFFLLRWQIQSHM